MKLDFRRAPQDLDETSVRQLPSSCGVYVLVSGDEILKIGYAGARELFGLRSALSGELARDPGGVRVQFYAETTMQYWGRSRELITRYATEFHDCPRGNSVDELVGLVPARVLNKGEMA